MALAVVKTIGTVASVAMPIAENWTVRRCRYAPEGESAGRLCLATGIHGDEMMGQLIAFGVAQRIMEEPEHLRGVVDIYPMLNPLGLDINERLVPSGTRLDMNRAFPGAQDGTPLERMCHALVQDMLGADLVLDIHTSTRNASELYGVRMNAENARRMIPQARALCPEMIWVYPERETYSALIATALSAEGTPALIIQADQRRHLPQPIAQRVVDGIFCKMKEMGLWTGDTMQAPAMEDIPCVRTREEAARISCETPGIYVPEASLGKWVEAGAVLGTVIDALEGVVREEIKAPCAGLVYTQRNYSAVYPGTLIAHICKNKLDGEGRP